MALKFLRVDKLFKGFNNGGWEWKKKLIFLLILSEFFIVLELISMYCHFYKTQSHERIIPNQKEEAILQCGKLEAKFLTQNGFKCTLKKVCSVEENTETLRGHGDKYMEAKSQCFIKDISMSPLRTSKEPSSKCFMCCVKKFSPILVGFMMTSILSYLLQRLWAKPNQELAQQGNLGRRRPLQNGNQTSSISERPSGRWKRILLYILIIVRVYVSIMVFRRLRARYG